VTLTAWTRRRTARQGRLESGCGGPRCGASWASTHTRPWRAPQRDG